MKTKPSEEAKPQKETRVPPPPPLERIELLEQEVKILGLACQTISTVVNDLLHTLSAASKSVRRMQTKKPSRKGKPK